MEMSFLDCIWPLDGWFWPERTTGGNLRKKCSRQYTNQQGYITAVHGHMLVDAALNAMLIAMAYDSPPPGTDALDRPHDGTQELTNDPPASTAVSNGDLKEAASLFDNLISLDKMIEEICSADMLS